MQVNMTDATIAQMTCPVCVWDFGSRTVRPCADHE